MGRHSKLKLQLLQAATKGRESQKMKRNCHNEAPQLTKKLRIANDAYNTSNATTSMQTLPTLVRSSNSLSTSVELQCSTAEIFLSNEANKPDEDQCQPTPMPQQVKIIMLPSVSSKMSSKAIQVTSIAKRKQRYLQAPGATSSEMSKGRRIISIASMNSTILEISQHSSLCGKGPVQFSSETKRGLCSKCIYKCGCGKLFQIKSDTEENSLPINDAIVWGNTQSAIGYTSSSSLFTTLEIPSAGFQLYKKHQDNVHLLFTKEVNKNMRMWAEKEKELALHFIIIL